MISSILTELLAELRRIRQALERSERELLSITAAAKRLGVSKTTLAELVARGRVASVPVGKRARISRAEIERLSREGLPRLDARGRPRKQRSVADRVAAIMAIPVD